jgi:hypothetical protein
VSNLIITVNEKPHAVSADPDAPLLYVLPDDDLVDAASRLRLHGESTHPGLAGPQTSWRALKPMGGYKNPPRHTHESTILLANTDQLVVFATLRSAACPPRRHGAGMGNP